MSSESRKQSESRLTFNWKIINYSLCQLKNGEWLKSPVICTDTNKWYLKLYPKGAGKARARFISCFLYGNEECKKTKNYPTSFTLAILNSNGKSLSSMEKKPACLPGNGTYELLEIEQLTNDIKNWKNDVLDIRCQLFDANYKQQPFSCEAQTEIQMHKYSFDWKVTVTEIQDWFQIVKCQFEKWNPIDITLTAPDNKIYLKIQKPNDQPLSELWKLKICILNQEGIDIDLKNSTYLFESSDFETSFEKKHLGDKSDFTSIYSFKLMCTIYVSDGTWRSTSVSYSYENVTNDEIRKLVIPCLRLQKDLKNMLLSKEHSDLILHAGNEIIPVHKCLLSARSPVFSAMFKRDMTESQTGIVDIPDVEIEVLRSFVDFLYTDTFTNTDLDHVLKLMLVSDKYQVDTLKEGCSHIVMPKISLENVCEVVSVADLVNQVNLKQFAFNYIKTNKMAILLSSDWSEWVEKNMKLAIEILTKLSTD